MHLWNNNKLMPESGNKGNFDEVVASLIQAHAGALQPLIYGKECYIVIVIYLSYKHKQFQIIWFNCMQNSWSVQRNDTW